MGPAGGTSGEAVVCSACIHRMLVGVPAILITIQLFVNVLGKTAEVGPNFQAAAIHVGVPKEVTAPALVTVVIWEVNQ